MPHKDLGVDTRKQGRKRSRMTSTFCDCNVPTETSGLLAQLLEWHWAIPTWFHGKWWEMWPTLKNYLDGQLLKFHLFKCAARLQGAFASLAVFLGHTLRSTVLKKFVVTMSWQQAGVVDFWWGKFLQTSKYGNRVCCSLFMVVLFSLFWSNWVAWTQKAWAWHIKFSFATQPMSRDSSWYRKIG